jgi:hypothetical protein
MARLKIIARFRDGRMIGGTTNNFRPEGAMFHMVPANARPGDRPVQVSLDELKAMFVVHDLRGDRTRPKRARFQAGAAPYGQKLEVTFEDGELLEGVSLNYDPRAPGFFLLPANPDSNNKRIFVVNSAVASVRRL